VSRTSVSRGARPNISAKGARGSLDPLPPRLKPMAKMPKCDTTRTAKARGQKRLRDVMAVPSHIDQQSAGLHWAPEIAKG
jgi:hypothetical protein